MVKKVILKALLSLDKDKRGRADKGKQNQLIAVTRGTLLTRPKSHHDSEVRNKLLAEEDTHVDFILHSIFDDLISLIVNSHAEPAAKAQKTEAVAPKSSTSLVEIMNQRRLSKEAKRVFVIAASTV